MQHFFSTVQERVPFQDVQRVEESNLEEEDLTDVSFDAVEDTADKGVEDSTKRGTQACEFQEIFIHPWVFTHKRPKYLT